MFGFFKKEEKKPFDVVDESVSRYSERKNYTKDDFDKIANDVSIKDVIKIVFNDVLDGNLITIEFYKLPNPYYPGPRQLQIPFSLFHYIFKKFNLEKKESFKEDFCNKLVCDDFDNIKKKASTSFRSFEAEIIEYVRDDISLLVEKHVRNKLEYLLFEKKMKEMK